MSPALTEWANKISKTVIPIHSVSLRLLREYAKDDDVHISKLSEVIMLDPGLTVSLLRRCNELTMAKSGSEVTTMSQAFMLLGSNKVLQMAMQLPELQKQLKPEAQKRLLITYSRAYHAAFQAMQWAMQRRDMEPEEIFIASMLHFLAEILISIHSPEVLDQIDHLKKTRHIPSEEAQYLVLGFSLDELSLEIAEHWHLPSLVREALQSENANFPRPYGIMLAVQLARHASIHWSAEKTQKIISLAAEWLDDDEDSISTDCHKHAAEAARKTVHYDVISAAERLLYIPVIKSAEELQNDSRHVDICLIPQLPTLRESLANIHNYMIQQPREFITTVLKAMHDCIGFNRAIFALYDKEEQKLVTYQSTGAENDPDFNRIIIKTNEKNLFSLLLKKTQAIVINNSNREKFWELVPGDFKKITGTNSFTAMSVMLNDTPIGLFYADRHSNECQIDDVSYRYFKTVCKEASLKLAKTEKLSFR